MRIRWAERIMEEIDRRHPVKQWKRIELRGVWLSSRTQSEPQAASSNISTSLTDDLPTRFPAPPACGMRAMYMVAVSMDGTHLLDTVPAVGIGGTAVYPQPSVVAYVQWDEQGMWGRNCPACERYFRTTHIHQRKCLSLLCGGQRRASPSSRRPAGLYRRELRRIRTGDGDR